MKKQKQLVLHDPDNEIYGDCDRTTVACLLNISVECVPHWGSFFPYPEKYNQIKSDYLASKGLMMAQAAYDGIDSLETVLASVGSQNPNMFYFLTGKSKLGCNHVVICLNDQIHWDPSPLDTGIVGPADDGYYHIEFLVSVLHKHEPEDAPA